MKDIKIYLLAIIVITNIATYSCTSKKTNDIVSNYKDTIKIDTPKQLDSNYELLQIARELNIAQLEIESLKDSISTLKVNVNKVNSSRDSVIFLYKAKNEKLAIAEYKLLRIREYNRIAAKGNNIKFLRGWINRVITN